jgi:hypothetical protein
MRMAVKGSFVLECEYDSAVYLGVMKCNVLKMYYCNTYDFVFYVICEEQLYVYILVLSAII